VVDRWITQYRFYEPEKGLHGNCQQAAVGSLLGLRLAEVPNFMEQPQGFWRSFWDFVRERGFAIVELSGPRHFDCYHLAYGPSARGCGHAVIYRAGKLVWDPHPSRAGLIEVETCCLLVPQDPAEWRRVHDGD
jgi:hypothetical protein